MILFFLACSGTPSETDSADAPADTSSAAEPDVPALVDAENGSCDLSLSLTPVPIASHTDAFVDWSALTMDLRGRPLAPDQITFVELLWFRNLDLPTVEAGLVAGTLGGGDVTVYAAHWPATPTAMRLSDLQFDGTPFQPTDFLAAGGVWILRLNTPEDATARVVALAPNDDYGPGTITLTDDQASFAAAVDLSGAEPVGLPVGTTTLDWSAVTTDATGAPARRAQMQELRIARFDDVAAAEAGWATMDSSAQGVWRLDVYGETAADVAQAAGVDGGFPGFDADHTWILTLGPSDASIVAPQFLGRAEVSP